MNTPANSDSERLERIESLVEILVTEVGKIAVAQAEMKTSISALQHDMGVIQNMAAMKHDMAVLQSDMGVMQHDMGVIKGWQTELVVERRARSVFRRLCGGNLLRIYPDIELHHYISNNRNAGNLTRDESSRVSTADFLLEGTDSEGMAVMYAVEVSYTMGIGDTDRALDKAALLTRALGRDVRPAVLGESAIAQFEADAARRSVSYAYIGNGRGITR